MLKSKNVIYPVAIMFMLLIPTVRYHISTPGNNDCMSEYVKNMDKSDYTGNIYKLNGGGFHIEPANSNLANSIADKKIGEVNGCIMASGDLFRDLNNTIYCSITYVINKSPIFHEVKEPLALVEGEMINIFRL